ncbi:MAG: hypothetical protein ACKVT0_04885 [Planctomycetaceae bacterium]
MKEVSSSNFGLLIAYLVPGFMVLWGMSYFSETIRSWLSASGTMTPTVGGFMYVTLASVAAGVTVSTVRWAVIDTIHHWTGLPQPVWDFSRLQDNVEAYNVINEIHYKYYQFHGNALLALFFVYVARRLHLGFFTAPLGWFDTGFVLLSVILFVGSRDTLHKYHSRVNDLLANKSVSMAVRQCEPPAELPDENPLSK